MPPVLSKPVAIDQEWAATLIGLRLKVPERWWAGCTGSKLFHGKIIAIDFSDDAKRYFKFEPDSEKGAHYPIRYDAVLHYADEDHQSYSKFLLPSVPPAAPVPGEAVRVRQRSTRQPIFGDDSFNEAEDQAGQPRRRNKRRRVPSESEEDGYVQVSLADDNAGADLW